MAIEPTRPSTMSIALQGLKREFKSIAENAEKIANFATVKDGSTESLVEPMLAMNQDLRDVKAITKVIKVQEEMDDAVLSIIA
ncbi:MAG: hypothetical protein KDD60_02260 [Bdellovibrionales bacterium]|nr:hypothetical protein [Bdellovibrionales bacterium]